MSLKECLLFASFSFLFGTVSWKEKDAKRRHSFVFSGTHTLRLFEVPKRKTQREGTQVVLTPCASLKCQRERRKKKALRLSCRHLGPLNCYRRKRDASLLCLGTWKRRFKEAQHSRVAPLSSASNRRVTSIRVAPLWKGQVKALTRCASFKWKRDTSLLCLGTWKRRVSFRLFQVPRHKRDASLLESTCYLHLTPFYSPHPSFTPPLIDTSIEARTHDRSHPICLWGLEWKCVWESVCPPIVCVRECVPTHFFYLCAFLL